jgi:hypothetical protein
MLRPIARSSSGPAPTFAIEEAMNYQRRLYIEHQVRRLHRMPWAVNLRITPWEDSMRKINARYIQVAPDSEEQALIAKINRLERTDLSVNELIDLLVFFDNAMQVAIAKAPEQKRAAMWRDYLDPQFRETLERIRAKMERRIIA